MRLGLSHLRQQLHSFRIIDSSYCLNCPNCLETVTHYLLNCPQYTCTRLEMMTDMVEIVVGNGMNFENYHAFVNIMLQGSDQLTEQENIQVLNMVQKFIGSTQRFM